MGFQQHRQLPGLMHHNLKTVLGSLLQLGLAQYSLHQQHRMLNARLPQRHPLFEGRHAQRITGSSQGFGNGHQAVTVSIRFDHRQHLTALGRGSRRRHIMPEGSQINDRTGSTTQDQKSP